MLKSTLLVKMPTFMLRFSISRTRLFGNFVPEEMCKTLSKSPVFSEMTISMQDLEELTTKMMGSLRVGFRKGYLVRYPEMQMSSMLI